MKQTATTAVVGKLEPTLKASQIAKLLQVSPRTVHRWLRDDPRVFKLGTHGRANKTDRVTIRIPESVVPELIREWKAA